MLPTHTLTSTHNIRAGHGRKSIHEWYVRGLVIDVLGGLEACLVSEQFWESWKHPGDVPSVVKVSR